MSDKSDWIDWGGGECPVARRAEVEVFCRGMDKYFLALKPKSDGKASHFYWKHDDCGSDIIKYRVIGEAK